MSKTFQLNADASPEDCATIMEHFGCKNCGWCCENRKVFVTEDEILKIRKQTKLFVSDLIDVYEPPNYLKRPCPFLKTFGEKSRLVYWCKCSIHDIRPEACRMFPLVWKGSTLLAINKCPLAQEIVKNLGSGTMATQIPNWHIKKMAEKIKEDGEG